eukprot:TRINITY_DN12197_c0_g1_i1.p1 TRINITY_DN12197_c0_g1~~TRINITY_DN12197_c0_g1_i1.p1  ORF type:complete len:135 (+),score=3.37 TRINITY_DN12197_c0_g1_i1:82-486(+)
MVSKQISQTMNTYFTTASVWLAVTHTTYLYTDVGADVLLLRLGFVHKYFADLLGHLYFTWRDESYFEMSMLFWHLYKYTSLGDKIPGVILHTGDMIDALAWVLLASKSGHTRQTWLLAATFWSSLWIFRLLFVQ